MSLDDKLIEVGLVVLVFLPVAGLFLYRWRRGKLRHTGLWTPRSVIERGERLHRERDRGERTPSGP